MTFSTHSRLSWTVTTQHHLLCDVQNEKSRKIYCPSADKYSKVAFRASLLNLFSNTVPFMGLGPLLLAFLPFYMAHWFWQRHRQQPGWIIDLHQRSIQTVWQKYDHSYQLTSEMGLLAHHRQIDITHPSQGPILTLFTAASSKDPLDAKAMANLAHILADRLQLRLVGCRIDIS